MFAGRVSAIDSTILSIYFAWKSWQSTTPYPSDPLRLFTSFQSLETLRSSFIESRIALSSQSITEVYSLYWLFRFDCLFLLLLVLSANSHWLLRSSWADVTWKGFFFRAEIFCSSDSVNRCCMHIQMNSYACGDIRLRTLRKLTSVDIREMSKSSAVVSTSRSAWIKQHCWLNVVSLARNSSFTMSKPPVAQIVKTTPRSNKSLFFNS